MNEQITITMTEGQWMGVLVDLDEVKVALVDIEIGSEVLIERLRTLGVSL